MRTGGAACDSSNSVQDTYAIVSFRWKQPSSVASDELGKHLHASSRRYGFLGMEEILSPQPLRILEKGDGSDEARRNETAESYRIYFSNFEGAKAWLNEGADSGRAMMDVSIEVARNQDWDAKWRESYKGADVEPFWKIRPVWERENTQAVNPQKTIWLNPSSGFGAGTHPTTQLCLETIGRLKLPKDFWALDFGAGSGILSVALAKQGARVDAVEIDRDALECARECVEHNGEMARVDCYQFLPERERLYDVIVANILQPVLLQFADALVSRLSAEGKIILSGLLEGDVAEVKAKYSQAYKKLGRDIRWNQSAIGEWQCLTSL